MKYTNLEAVHKLNESEVDDELEIIEEESLFEIALREIKSDNSLSDLAKERLEAYIKEAFETDYFETDGSLSTDLLYDGEYAYMDGWNEMFDYLRDSCDGDWSKPIRDGEESPWGIASWFLDNEMYRWIHRFNDRHFSA